MSRPLPPSAASSPPGGEAAPADISPTPTAGAALIKPGDRVQMHSRDGRSVWIGIVIGYAPHGMLRVLWDDGDWPGWIEPELVEVVES